MIWDALVQDVRYTIRTYARTPSFTAAIVATLALGIGASTSIFSMVNGIVLRPLPLPDPDRLVYANEVNAGGMPISVAWPNFLDWRARARSFEGLAGSREEGLFLTGGERPDRLRARRVTADFFRVLGVQPAIGRAFVDDEDRPGTNPVVVVSDGFWRDHLGADPAALGRSITLSRRPHTVVGVLPRDFRYLRAYDVFVPMGPIADNPSLLDRGNHQGFHAVGRLKPAITPDNADRELRAIAASLETEHPKTNSAISVRVDPLAERLIANVKRTLLVLLGAVGFLLLIACVNVANLLIARGAARRHELAVRAALGGGRGRLMAQLLVESSLVSAAGGALGVALAWWLLRVLLALAPEGTPRIETVALDAAAVLFALAAATVCGLVFGAVPALQASSVRGQHALVRGRAAQAAAASHRVRRVLIVAEVALALVLLAGAGLMVRTLRALTAVDLGFRPDHLFTMMSSLVGNEWTDPRVTVFHDDLLGRLRALPGVSGAALAYSLPIDGSNWNSVFIVGDKPVPPRPELPSSTFTPVSAGYFETMDMRLARGRFFTEADRAGGAMVAVINETLARRLWPGEDPIGRRVKQGWPESPTPWREVVGVARDVKFEGLAANTPMQIYLPVAQEPSRSMWVVVRTHGNPAAIRSSVEAAAHAIDKDIPLYAPRTMEQFLDNSVARERMAMLVLIVFASVALVLASVGLYGLVSQSVTERTHEIGVRVALGAEARQILALVVGQGIGMATVGLGIGIAGALALSRGLEGLLFDVKPTDPPTLAAVSVMLFAVALMACYVPARRAARVDPASALRAE